MEVKVVVVVVTVTVTVVTVTVTVVTISFWRGGSRPPPIKGKSKGTHFGGGFPLFAVFGPRRVPIGQLGTTSTEKVCVQYCHREGGREDDDGRPLLPTVVRKLFTQLFGRFPTFTFSRTTIFFRKSEF